MIVVHGSYFANNFGDTLLVKIVCDELASIVGREKIFLAIPGDRAEQKSIGYPVIPKRMEKDVTHVVYAGGGYFGEPSGNVVMKTRWSLRNYYRHIAWLKKFPDAEVGIFGVGYGPISIKWFRRNVSKVISRARFVYFRDDESIAYYKEYGGEKFVNKCVDFALGINRNHIARTKDVIGVHLPGLGEPALESALRPLRDHIINKEVDVIFDNPISNFEAVSNRIASALRTIGAAKVTIRPYVDFESLIGLLTGYEYVITNKLHVGIVTIALGGKVLSIPTHNKTQRLYRQLGLQDYCIPVDEMNDEALLRAVKSLDKFNPDEDVIEAGLAGLRGGLRDFVLGCE